MTLALAGSEPVGSSFHIVSQVPEHLLWNISRSLTLWRQGATFSFRISWECKVGSHFPLHSPTYFPHLPTPQCGKYLLQMQLPSSLSEISPCNHLPLCEWKRNTVIGSMNHGSVRRGRKMQGWKIQGFFKIKNTYSNTNPFSKTKCSKFGHLRLLFFAATKLKQSFELMQY